MSKDRFGYNGEVDYFVVNEGSFNTTIAHLFERKTILANARVLEAASELEIVASCSVRSKLIISAL